MNPRTRIHHITFTTVTTTDISLDSSCFSCRIFLTSISLCYRSLYSYPFFSGGVSPLSLSLFLAPLLLLHRSLR